MSPLQKAERPKSLKQLKTVYHDRENAAANDGNKGLAVHGMPSSEALDSRNLSILSPFDEQEEWAKISEIVASFGSSLMKDSTFVTELEQEFQTRLGLTREGIAVESPKITIGKWLTIVGFSEYENAFLEFGYDNIDFINGVINDCDLKELGIVNECDRELLLQGALKLPNKIGEYWRNKIKPEPEKDKESEKENASDSQVSVEEWLESLNLSHYVDSFKKHLYTDMEKIKRIWEVELTAVLEITKPGHRRRILASIQAYKSRDLTSSKSTNIASNLEELSADLNQLKSNLRQLKHEIRTKIPPESNDTNVPVSHRHHKKSRPAPPPPIQPQNLKIRNPSELLMGVPSMLTTQWRHQPHALITGTVNYVASYLGSTVVKELRGTESTKKSIQKLKKSTSVVDCRVTPEIILAIWYRGVKFLNVNDQSLICEHEIRNIRCACQDAEDLTHFAYITKDHTSKTHYCHVFCVQTMDQATEVILTLGEAFEVAYQVSLREHAVAHGGYDHKAVGHTRSHSVNDMMENSPSRSTNNDSHHHLRSHSINNIRDDINNDSSIPFHEESTKDDQQPPPNGTSSETPLEGRENA